MRYPLVKQNGIKECGPCCLASIINYYNGYISVDTLSLMMHTTKDGTTAYDLIETAKKIGFESYGVKKNIEEINNITLPCIAHITLSNTYNHFVIIYKIDYKKEKILIGDPADKLKYLSFSEFKNVWNKVLILLMPLKPMPYTKHKSLFNYVKDNILENKNRFIVIILLSILFIILSLIYSLFIRYLIDNITLINKTIIYILLILLIIKTIILYYKNRILINSSKNISISLTNKIIKSLILLPYPYYKNHTTGEILSRFNDVECIKSTINEFIIAIVDIPFIILVFSLIYIISGTLSFYIFFLLIIYIIFYYILGKKINRSINKYYEEKSQFNSELSETICGFESIKGINIEDKLMNNLINKHDYFEKTIYDYQKLYNLKNICGDFITSVGSTIILCLGFIMIKNNNISIGSLIIIYVLYNYLIEPINNLLNIILRYYEASFVSRRIQDLNYKKDIGKLETDSYNIFINNLTYKIGLKEILTNIKININKGERVFIMGPSGSGKSSLAKLIKGYYKTNNIMIGKKNIYDINTKKILYIGPNEFLFTNTLKSNLLCDDDKKIKDIFDKCLIKNNSNLLIEENGFNISSGEKQKIVLARALLCDFEILIIDEGLEEIDSYSERVILQNIFKYYTDKTIIVISHRYDNIDLFNHLIELCNGKIIREKKL